MTRDGDFMRLNLEPLATTIQANARAWVKELGKMLNDSARENLMTLKTELEVVVIFLLVFQGARASMNLCDRSFCLANDFLLKGAS